MSLKDGLLNSPMPEKKEPVKIDSVSELNDLRRRVVKGEAVSREELAGALQKLRQLATGQTKAQADKAKPAPKKTAKKKVDADDLLADMLKGL